MGRRKGKATSSRESRLQLKLIVGDDEIGPGKIQLLRLVQEHGGMSAARGRIVTAEWFKDDRWSISDRTRVFKITP